MSVIVSLGAATICFLGSCYPALIGAETPSGVFPLQQARILAPGYGGDVLLYAQRKDGVPLAVHRVWLGSPSQRRLERLNSPITSYRRGVTGGCINVAPEVYDALVACAQCRIITIQD